jgi:hypothetical protein
MSDDMSESYWAAFDRGSSLHDHHYFPRPRQHAAEPEWCARPWFTRNIVILTDSAGNTGPGKVTAIDTH